MDFSRNWWHFVARKANTPRRSSRILISGYAVMAVGLVIGALGGPVVGLIGFCLTAFMFLWFNRLFSRFLRLI